MGTNFSCVFVVMIGMMTHVQVSGTECKVRVRKALTRKCLQKLITNLAKGLDWEHSFLLLMELSLVYKMHIVDAKLCSIIL
jgi:hypothetical protein